MEDDDLDSLLKDLSSTPAGASAPIRQTQPSAQVSLASLLSELDCSPSRPIPEPRPTAAPLFSSQAPRCTSIVLGGAQVATCDRLRCLQCDFEVVAVDGAVWDQKVDYLFLRNNFPDRLQGMLRPRRGGRAYACQCSWASVPDPEGRVPLLQAAPNAKWFCGGGHKS